MDLEIQPITVDIIGEDLDVTVTMVRILTQQNVILNFLHFLVKLILELLKLTIQIATAKML
jgi:hypothetical protein